MKNVRVRNLRVPIVPNLILIAVVIGMLIAGCGLWSLLPIPFAWGVSFTRRIPPSWKV